MAQSPSIVSRVKLVYCCEYYNYQFLFIGYGIWKIAKIRIIALAKHISNIGATDPSECKLQVCLSLEK